MMLLTFFLGLLHLLAGVCDADVVDDDLLNPTTFIYANPYPIAKPYDCRVIANLATKGQCMSYIGVDGTPSETLASCELYCWETFYANTWDVSIQYPSLVVAGYAGTFIDRGMTLNSLGLGISDADSPTHSAPRPQLTRATRTGTTSSRTRIYYTGLLVPAPAPTPRTRRFPCTAMVTTRPPASPRAW